MNILDYLLENSAIKSKLNLMSKSVKKEYMEKLSDISVFFSASFQDVESLDLGDILSNPDPKEQQYLDEKLMALNAILGNLVEIDEFKTAADEDADGELEEEELGKYLETMMGKDGNDKDLTLEDFDKILEELSISADELFQDDFDIIMGDSIEDFFESEENIDDIEGANDQYSQAFFEENGDSGVHLVMGNPSGKVDKPQNDLDRMSVEQLKTEEEKRQASVNEQKEAINAIHNGENPQVKMALDKEKEAKDEYQKALDEDSSPQVKALKEEQNKNDVAIQENKTQISAAEININNKEVEYSQQETKVGGIKNEINSLESTLASLPSPTGKPEDAEKDTQIEEKKAAIEEQITAKKAELQEEEIKLAQLKTDVEDAKTTLNGLNTTKEQLENTRDSLEDEVLLVASKETKEALSNYQAARSNVEGIKDKELTTAKANLTTAQTSLTEVSNKINEKDISKAKRDNSINQGSDVAEFAMSLKGLSEKEMQAYMWKNYNEGKEWKDQCPFNEGGYCADFVYFAWRMTVGDEGLPDWYRNCENFSYPANIDRKARAAGALRDFSTVESVVNTVKPGDLITYGNHVEGEGGHIGMIAEVRDDGTIVTIEGNTVPYGSVNSHEIKFEQFAQKNIHQIISMDS